MNAIKTHAVAKITCSIFVIYYTWLRVIVPSIEGLLIPLGLIMIGSIILSMMKNRAGIVQYLDFPIVSWLLFCLLEYVAAFFVSEDTSLSHRSIFTFFELVMMCFAIVFVARLDGSIDFLIKIMYATSVCYVLSMLVISNHIGGRLALVNANGDANVCLIGIVTATLIIDFKKIVQPFVVMSTICMMFYADIMTGSRKSFACMIFYLFFWGAVFFRTEWKLLNDAKKIALLGMLFFSLFAVIRFVTPVLMNSVTIQRFTDEGAERSDLLRAELYEDAWGYFKDRPLLGIGYNQFRVLNVKGFYSHSTYAEILACGGLLGFCLFFAPHIWCVINLIRIARKYRGNNFDEMKISLLLLVYMLSSMLLATGMVQTSNERLLMMYAIMFAYIVCEKIKERTYSWGS